MKKKVPITVENKKTVERNNNFPAGYDFYINTKPEKFYFFAIKPLKKYSF